MSTDATLTEIATLHWEGRTVTLTYEADWLDNEGIDHLTVECVEPPHGPLPITETGYRSAFFHACQDDDLPGANFVVYVRAWLDEAAQGKEWLAYIEANRQLRLFD